MMYCIFSAQYLPTFGGVERYTYNIAKNLIDRGNDVVIVTTMLKGQSKSELDENGAMIIRVRSMHLLNGRLPVMRIIEEQELYSKLDTLPIERIVVQTRLYTLCLEGMKYASRRNIQSIVIEHGSGFIGSTVCFVRWAEMLYEKILILGAKKLCNSFYAVSRTSSEWLATIGIQSKGVLYNSVDAKAIDQQRRTKTKDYRTEYHIPSDSEIIVFVGRMIPEKGILQLDMAMKRLCDKYNVCFIAAGDGPLLKRLQEEATEGMHYVGNISHNDVISLLSCSDIMCLPSDNEGFPTSVMEAVICECYVVVSPYGGTKELICNDNFGTVLPDNSEEAIFGGISKAIENKTQRKRAIINAKKRMLESFTWAVTTDELIDAFD